MDTKSSRENFSPGLPRFARPKRPAAVLLLELLPLLLGQLRKAAVVGRREVDGARHGHVRADPGEWLENLRLRLVESRGQRVDRHDETDSEAEAERGEDRPPASPTELRDDVGEKEHGAERSAGK